MENTARNNINNSQNTTTEQQKTWYLDVFWNLNHEISTDKFWNPIMGERVNPNKTYFLDQNTGKIYAHKIEHKNFNFTEISTENLEKTLETRFKNQQEENIKAHQNLTNTENQRENKEKDDKINDLMNQLNDTKEGMKSLSSFVKELSEKLNENREQNSKILEEIKETKRNPNVNNDILKWYKILLSKLRQARRDAKKKAKEDFKKYNPDEIATLDNWLLRWGLSNIWVMSIRKGIGISYNWEKISLRSRTRRKLNKTIKKLNDIKDDPKRWVKYIMSKTRKRWSGKIGAWIKRWYNSLIIRDTDKFDKVFNEQKKFFIDDLEEKIKANYKTKSEYENSNDYKSIKAIKNRVEYYQDAYKRKIITV